jgi:hypothetical protein
MWDPLLDGMRDRDGRLYMGPLSEMPVISCITPPSIVFASGAIRQALQRLETRTHGAPSRVLLRNPIHGGNACTVTWTVPDDRRSNVTLRIRTSPGVVHVHLRDPSVGADPVELALQDLVPAPRPDERESAVVWATAIAVDALRTTIGAAVQAGLIGDRDELRPRVEARHREEYRHVVTAASVMISLTGTDESGLVGLGLPMPWSHGTWSPRHEDEPLTASENGRMVEAYLRGSIPPSINLDPIRTDGLSFRLNRDNHLVSGEAIHPVELMRLIAEWRSR